MDRTFDLLETLAGADDAVSLSELGGGLGISLTTVHRLLQTMVRRGYADQDPKTRRYGPGPKVLEVAARSTTNRHFDLRRVALPLLRKLTAKTGETSNLILPYGTDEIVYIEQSKSPQTVSIFTQVGHRAPLYCTAAGKAILANFSQMQLENYLARTELEPATDRTLTTEEDLLRELEVTRQRGFAVDDEEREEGVRCAAAPILNYVGICVGAISVSGPSTRIGYERILSELGPGVSRQAEKCSARLGHGAPVGGTNEEGGRNGKPLLGEVFGVRKGDGTLRTGEDAMDGGAGR
ncbi:IclR family transcriptional regulator [Rubrobacter tropicus]|uniref:IclR family transcriptional regulator n=1 Tax=Rubrobacter tropicus TaxID=2653851 RepID=UPI001A9DD180|nr:IclR family transcriptional regulator [Rubrobacter tropicus]